LDERLQYYTDGKVKLQIYPGGSLYGAYEMYDALATGALDMAFMSDYQFMMTGFTDFEMFWLNCWWGETMEESSEHNDRYWAHPDGGRKLFSKVGERGIKMLTNLPSGSAQWLVNDFEMKSLWDMKGKKIAGAPGLGGLFVKRAEGIVAIIDPVEFTIAFQQGLVDIYPTGAESVMGNKLYEMACCSFVVDVLNVVSFISMNMDLWNSLEPELQDIMQNKVAPDVVAWSEVEDPKSRAESEQAVQDVGHVVHYISPEERIDFRDADWEMAIESGLLVEMDQELLKIADQLRNEPYDQGEFFP
jgi:TRAP-type C4-dicarboxylate transport system substrate-binding protein